MEDLREVSHKKVGKKSYIKKRYALRRLLSWTIPSGRG